MEIKTVTSNFPGEITSVIIEILRHTSEGLEIRDKLNSIYGDSWIVVQGKQFSYVVSRASKSAGIFSNKAKGLKFLIYTPPYTELTPYFPPLAEGTGNWNLTLIKKTSNNSGLIEDLFQFMKKVDYSDCAKSAELIKMKANLLEERFWHVVVGCDFVCTLPNKTVEHLIYCKAKKGQDNVDIVVFRQQGAQKKVNWTGLFTGTLYVCLTFMFFLGVFGMLKCGPTSQTWLCSNYKTLLYIGLAYVFSKASKTLMKKLKRT